MCLLKHQPQHQHHLHPCLWILTLWIFTFLRLLVAFQGSRCCSLGCVFSHTFSIKKTINLCLATTKTQERLPRFASLPKYAYQKSVCQMSGFFKKKQHLTSNKQQGMFPTLRPTISAIHQTPGKKTPKSPVPCSPLPGEIRSVWFRKYVSPPHRFFRMAKKKRGVFVLQSSNFLGGILPKKNGTIYITCFFRIFKGAIFLLGDAVPPTSQSQYPPCFFRQKL